MISRWGNLTNVLRRLGCLALIAVVGACGPSPTSQPSGSNAGSLAPTTPSPTESPSVSQRPPIVPTPAASLPPFGVLGVTFVSASHGWALLNAQCSSGGCLRIVETRDGGATWTDIQPPPVKPGDGAIGTPGASSIRFANATDGWVFGPSLWSTHDDGATWNEIQVPGLLANSVQQLEVVGARVAAIGTDQDQTSPGYRIAEAATGSDAWAVTGARSDYGAGPEPTPSLVSSHGTAWYLQVDRVPIDGQRRSSTGWAAWQPPCLGENGPAVLGAGSALELAAACDVGVWGDSASGLAPGVWTFISHDGGDHFAAVGGTLPLSGVRSISMATTSVIVVAGYDQSGDVLLRSTDGGKTWKVVQRVSSGEVRYLGFTTATQGVVILTGTSHGLLMTHDGGATWSVVHL